MHLYQGLRTTCWLNERTKSVNGTSATNDNFHPFLRRRGYLVEIHGFDQLRHVSNVFARQSVSVLSCVSHYSHPTNSAISTTIFQHLPTLWFFFSKIFEKNVSTDTLVEFSGNLQLKRGGCKKKNEIGVSYDSIFNDNNNNNNEDNNVGEVTNYWKQSCTKYLDIPYCSLIYRQIYRRTYCIIICVDCTDYLHRVLIFKIADKATGVSSIVCTV